MPERQPHRRYPRRDDRACSLTPARPSGREGIGHPPGDLFQGEAFHRMLDHIVVVGSLPPANAQFVVKAVVRHFPGVGFPGGGRPYRAGIDLVPLKQVFLRENRIHLAVDDIWRGSDPSPGIGVGSGRQAGRSRCFRLLPGRSGGGPASSWLMAFRRVRAGSWGSLILSFHE